MHFQILTIDGSGTHSSTIRLEGVNCSANMDVVVNRKYIPGIQAQPFST